MCVPDRRQDAATFDAKQAAYEAYDREMADALARQIVDCVGRGERWTICCAVAVGGRTSCCGSAATSTPCCFWRNMPMARRPWFERYLRARPRHRQRRRAVGRFGQDVGLDFANAEVRVVRFAVAYLGNRVTVISLSQRSHAAQGDTAPRRDHRAAYDHEQVQHVPRDHSPASAAAHACCPDCRAIYVSPYSSVLQLAAKWRSKPRRACLSKGVSRC